jgi:hypothetical protein
VYVLQALVESKSYGIDFLRRPCALEQQYGHSPQVLPAAVILYRLNNVGTQEIEEVNLRHQTILSKAAKTSAEQFGKTIPFGTTGTAPNRLDGSSHPVGAGYRSEYATGVSLQDELTRVLWFSTRKVDDFYFSLVDTARNDVQVPEIAVNAAIAAAGKVNTHVLVDVPF